MTIRYDARRRKYVAHIEVTADEARFLADCIPDGDLAQGEWLGIAQALEARNEEADRG